MQRSALTTLAAAGTCALAGVCYAVYQSRRASSSSASASALDAAGDANQGAANEDEDSSSLLLGDSAYLGLIGNTPLVELKRLSRLLGCRLLVKMESSNPGGTGKDRAAKYMLLKAARDPRYRRGCHVVEGTSGSTGIALAALCRAEGLHLHVVMPDDQAAEKRLLLESLGASVTVVPPCAISNPNHYVNAARALATRLDGIFFDQFENPANFEAHHRETGPEIWRQTRGAVDAFVMSAGTGGTIAGVSKFLKERKAVRVVLADPQGSSLLRKVTHGVCFTPEQSERRIKKHRYDSIVEGVGLDRVTANFDLAAIDAATSVSDQEIVLMAHWLLQNEGLQVGSSSALNIAAACQVARELGPGHTVVTVVCDQGQRHVSRFWNREYLASNGLDWPSAGAVPACLLPLPAHSAPTATGAPVVAPAAAPAAVPAASAAAEVVQSPVKASSPVGTAPPSSSSSIGQGSGKGNSEPPAGSEAEDGLRELAALATADSDELPPLLRAPALKAPAPPAPAAAPAPSAAAAPAAAAAAAAPAAATPVSAPAAPAAAAAAATVAAAAPTTATPKKPISRIIRTPAHAHAASLKLATPLREPAPSAFDDDDSPTAAAGATGGDEAARVQEMREKMSRLKEQQRIKRGLSTPQTEGKV